MKKFAILVLLLAFIFPVAVSAAPQAADESSVKIPNGPKFWVSNVVLGESVTVGFKEYPKGKKYQVRIGLPGDMNGAVVVGQLNDAKAPNFNKTFSIPKQFKHKTHLAIYIWNHKDSSHGYNIFANYSGYNWRDEMSFAPVHRSSAQSAGKSVGIFNGPTVWIGKQGFPNTVNVAFDDFYDDASYTVFIGPNNDYFPSLAIGYAGGRNGPRFTKEFDIPGSMKGYDELKITVVNGHNQHSGTMAFLYQDGYPSVTPNGAFTTAYATDSSGFASTATPYTNILNVVPDGEVTLQVFNFPPEKEFTVSMGPLGTRGIGGYVIGNQSTGAGGSFIVTYPIPPQLQGMDYIAIRLESTTTTHYAYDYFQNMSAGTSSSTGTGTAGDPVVAAAPAVLNGDWILPAGTYPSTTITAVVEGTSVTVNGSNFTRNDAYTVRMGAIGTKGEGGYVVATYNTAGSSFSATFTIPEALKDHAQIAVRFESVNSPYFAYDWFNNQTSP